MKPSFSRMEARDSFSFEPGIFTVSNMAELALRIRVSMSAMGSVIVMAGLPTCLRHAGNLAGMHHDAQADTAQPELAVIDLGEDQLLGDAEGVVPPAVERASRQAAEVTDAGNGQAEQPVEELP